MQVEKGLHILYNLFQVACLPLFPFISVYLISRAKYRRQFLPRLGVNLDLPEKKDARIWIHAMSLGEYNAARPLVHALCEKYKCADILLSASTMTGINAIRRDWPERNGRVITFPFPFDIFFVARRFARNIKPDCFIVVETDIWPNILRQLELTGCKCILVNGSISSIAARRLSHFPGAARFLYGSFSFLGMQSEDDKRRLKGLGVKKGKIEAVGNLKFDVSIPPLDEGKKGELLGQTGFKRERVIICAGSTHAPEEQLLLNVFCRLKAQHEDMRLILAPRNISRAQEISRLCSNMGLKYRLRSKGAGPLEPDVFILDTLGELVDFYSIAFVSFVGGTFAQVGGHNLLEPVLFGRPVLFGPNIESVREIATALEKAGAGKKITSEKGLETAIKELISMPQRYSKACASARSFISAHRGVTERYMKIIDRYFLHGKC